MAYVTNSFPVPLARSPSSTSRRKPLQVHRLAQLSEQLARHFADAKRWFAQHPKLFKQRRLLQEEVGPAFERQFAGDAGKRSCEVKLSEADAKKLAKKTGLSV